jgi:hypothetical protein
VALITWNKRDMVGMNEQRDQNGAPVNRMNRHNPGERLKVCAMNVRPPLVILDPAVLPLPAANPPRYAL